MFMLNVSHLENHARSCWIIGFLNAVFSTLLMIFSCLLWYCPIMMIFSILLATASKSNWLSPEKKLSFASTSFIFCNRRTTNQRWLTFLAIRSLGQLEFDTPRPRKRVGSPTGFRQWFSSSSIDQGLRVYPLVMNSHGIDGPNRNRWLMVYRT